MDKTKDGLEALQEQVRANQELREYAGIERQRKRTLRMLALLGITGGSEPGNKWVRVKDVEVELLAGPFEWRWSARPLGNPGPGNYMVESVHGNELLYRLGWGRQKLGEALVRAIEDARKSASVPAHEVRPVPPSSTFGPGRGLSK